MPHEKAAAIIAEGRGSHFDPDVVDAFFQIEQTFIAIAIRYRDSDQELQAISNHKRWLPLILMLACIGLSTTQLPPPAQVKAGRLKIHQVATFPFGRHQV